MPWVFVIFMMGFVVSWIWFHRFRGRFHIHTGSFRSSVVQGFVVAQVS